MSQNPIPTPEQELQELRQKYVELETEYHRCQTQLRVVQAKADRQEDHLHFVQQNYDMMVNSSGHRLLEKYYALRRLLRPSLWKEAIMNRLEPMLQKRRHKKNVRMHTLTRDDMYLILSKSHRMDVLADPDSEAAARQVQTILTEAGLECRVHLSEPAGYDSIPYIVMNAHCLSRLPEIFMVFHQGRKLTEDTMNVLRSAYAVFAPSMDIVAHLSKEGEISSRLYLMPMTNSTEAKYHLYRFLLAVDAIPFDRFYSEVGGHIHITTDRVCLSLPESPERRAAFDEENRYGFEVFPGLKHHFGWVGCGLSYKFIFRKAADQQMESILVCEDDTYFPADFDDRFAKLQAYISTHHDWDIFSGVMADMGNVTVQDCIHENGEDYVYLDKIISTVFNLYRSSMYSLISQWDNMNRNKKENAIDRYLENRNLRILTTCPFLVGHKEDLDSTIWNHKNDLYNPGIESSSKKLYLLVDDYKYRAKQNK